MDAPDMPPSTVIGLPDFGSPQFSSSGVNIYDMPLEPCFLSERNEVMSVGTNHFSSFESKNFRKINLAAAFRGYPGHLDESPVKRQMPLSMSAAQLLMGQKIPSGPLTKTLFESTTRSRAKFDNLPVPRNVSMNSSVQQQRQQLMSEEVTFGTSLPQCADATCFDQRCTRYDLPTKDVFKRRQWVEDCADAESDFPAPSEYPLPPQRPSHPQFRMEPSHPVNSHQLSIQVGRPTLGRRAIEESRDRSRRCGPEHGNMNYRKPSFCRTEQSITPLPSKRAPWLPSYQSYPVPPGLQMPTFIPLPFQQPGQTHPGALSPVASRSLLTCNRDFQSHYPNVYVGLCKGLLDVSRLIAHEVVIPIREEITLHKAFLRTRRAVVSVISDCFWKPLHGKFPDPAITPRLVRKVADYFFNKLDAGIRDAESERSVLQWLLRFDVENVIEIRVTTSFTIGSNSAIANIEGSASVRRKKGALFSLLNSDIVTMDMDIVVKALFLNGGQLAEINNDPTFIDRVHAGENRFAASFLNMY